MQENRSQLVSDIVAQPASLSCVLDQQFGTGHSELLRAASVIRSARRVLITGIGASMFASIPLEYALCACGIDAVVVEAAELLHYRHRAYRDAVAVVVSRSGESIEIAKLLAMPRKQQLVIGVTNEPSSLLARKADVSLHVGSRSDGMVAIQTYTGTLMTLYLLAEMVRLSRDPARNDIERWRLSFLEVVTTSYEQLGSWDPFLEAGAPIYLLGRGPSYASAMEGALLFNEIAKIPAVGMPAASFRHGPVEVVDDRFRGLIFASPGCTRDLNIALGRDLARFGGWVRGIGPAQESSPRMDWCDLPPVPEALAPLFEIVPVQMAALRMAQLRSIPEGSLRYAPQVTTDEASFGIPGTRASPE
ncbi:MAG TPA: SIS domain-containing protein [Acidobacteriaceae bacterium]|nr:SIS domain-containing protein [Acidobacteriaceae bacterium]